MHRLTFYLIFFFFFNDTATTEIYTLSLHDALPICITGPQSRSAGSRAWRIAWPSSDRKSTRLNSSHVRISYAVFCLKKKKLSICDDDASRKAQSGISDEMSLGA